MAQQGFAVTSGSVAIHKLLPDGTASFSGSVSITGSVVPDSNGTREFGNLNNRWKDVYAEQTTVGAIFETGLTTPGIRRYPTGMVLVWKNGELVPCSVEEDVSVIGVAKNGKDQPIVMGAEPVMIKGPIKTGDFIVTSNMPGHGRAAKLRNWAFMKKDLTGKIIGQALEDCDEEGSCLIKCWIQKM